MIHVVTTACSVNPPKIIIQDVYENELNPGSFVAFNKSGTIRKGKIISINRWEWKVARDGPGDEKWWYLLCSISIEEHITGEISTIKNPNSLFIL